MRFLLAILVLLTTLPCDGQVRRRVLGPKPSSAFTPASLPNLAMWLKPESIPAIPDDSTFTNWIDSSPNSWWVSNINVSPIVVSNGTINGYRSAAFKAGTGTGFNWGVSQTYVGDNMLSNVTSCSWFFVNRMWAIPTQRSALVYLRPGDGATFLRLEMGVLTAQTNILLSTQRLDADATDNSTSVPWPVGRWVIMEAQCRWTNASCSISTNGIAAMTDASWGTSGNTESTNSYAAHIGGIPTGGNPLNGDIAEVIATVPVCDAAQRLSVLTYFSNKFGASSWGP